MRRIAMLSAILLAAASLFAVSSAYIQSAAMQLNVPYDELEALVLKYNSTSNTSDGSDAIPLETIYADFTDNSISSEMKYNGKTLCISFTVYSLMSNHLSFGNTSKYRYVITAPNSVLHGFHSDVYFSAYPDDSEAGKLMNISKGQTITVEGRCEVETFGSLIYINLLGARII